MVRMLTTYVTVSLLLLSSSAILPAAETHDLTEQELRGKHIYLHGVSVSGRKIMTTIAGFDAEIPASALQCVNCHGYDGQGRPEGGLSPSNITWKSLTKPYDTKHASGRVHPAYDDRSFIKAISTGFDSGGNQLAGAMPRYRLTHGEAADLVAFIKRLGNIPEPGLTTDQVTIGVFLPKDASTANVVRAVAEAYFEDVSQNGGIFNRRIALQYVDPTSHDAESLLKEQVFAVCGAFIQGNERTVNDLAAQHQVPVIGAVTLFPQLDFPPNRYVFHLLSDANHMARAMVEFAAQDTNRRFAVAYPATDVVRSMGDAILQQFAKQEPASIRPIDWEYEATSFNAIDMVSRFKNAGVTSLFFLGSAAEQGELLAACRAEDWQPELWIPGPFATGRLLEYAHPDKTFVSFARGAEDQTQQAVKKFRDFARRHRLSDDHMDAQVHMYCAAMTFVEGLKRTERNAHREKLVNMLESLYEFETGLIPQITFGPNRRIGAKGAYIATLGAQQITPVSHWIAAE